MAQVKVEQPTMSEEQIQQTIGHIVGGLRHPLRSPILHSPVEHGLDYEEVFFPSQDGVPLEGWFMPAEGSKRLIIANHPMGFNRAGFPSHLEPWKSAFAVGGNDFEINLVPDYKILHDAGYNVLAYDLRNFGHSGSGSGIVSGGIYEARDVIGSLVYAKTREDLKDMVVGLFSRCLGANSSFFAMSQSPRYFEDVRCIVACQPVSVRSIMGRELELHGIPERINDLERALQLATSFKMDDLSPVNAAKSVRIPTFLYQVHDDLLTRPNDVQSMFDNISTPEKKLFWIKGTTRRWDGYNYFQKDPSQMLEWFDTYMQSDFSR